MGLIDTYKLKNPESIDPPKLYLGNKVAKVTLANGNETWAFSSSQYAQTTIANVKAHLKRFTMSLPRRSSSQLKNNYRPETNISIELNMRNSAYY